MPTDLNMLAPILAVLVSAAVAGYGSFLAGRGMRSHDWKLSLVREKLVDYRQLYARFLAEADQRMLLSAVPAKKGVDELTALFALFSELSLVASEPVSQSAARMCECALDSVAAEPTREQDYFAAKAAFIRAAREEIASLEASVQRR